MRTTTVLRALALLVLVLAWPLAAFAQPERKLVVLHESVTESDPDKGVDLRVYFTLRDGNDKIIDKNQFKLDDAATIQLLDDGRKTRAIVGEPDAPIKVVLLLDRSGSMISTIDVAKPAATEALKQMPPRTELFVYQFENHGPDQALGTPESFSKSSERWPTEVASWQPKDGAVTCLYNVTYQAVQLLAAAAGPADRRAIILFTDGVDEKSGNQPCSERPIDNVIAAAREVGVPVYTIGLCKSQSCADIDEGALRRMARETNGEAVTGVVSEIKDRFATIMAALNSQWMATAKVFPRQGANSAVLTVTPSDGTPAILGPFSFTSKLDYAPPPTFAPKASYEAEKDHFVLNLNATAGESIAAARVEILDKEGGTIVDTVAVSPGSLGQPVEIPTDKLKSEREYCLQVRATNRAGAAITRADAPSGADADPTLLGEACVKYEPRFQFSVASVTPDWENDRLAIQLNLASVGNRQLLFDGTIVDSANNKIADIRSVAAKEGVISIDLPPALRRASDREEFTIDLSTEAGGQRLANKLAFKIKPQTGDNSIWLISLGALLLVAVTLTGVVMIQRWRGRSRGVPAPLPYNTMTGRLDEPPPPPQRATKARSAAKAPAARLQISVLKTKDPTQKRDLSVTNFPFVIGRGERDTQLPIPGDDGLSRHHLQISVSGNEITVTDLKSLNGSFIDDQRLEPNTPVPIKGRTQLRLGPHTLIQIDLL